ncbi:LysR family transcriptional regulator [Gordonia sp. NPDC003376]
MASEMASAIDLNLRQVHYFVAVVDEGHLGRAADALYISAPALSQQIRKLERRLGTELLDRSAHPLRPTRAGDRLLAEARVLLQSATRAVEAVRDESARLRIGFMTASMTPQARRLLAQLRDRHPECEIDLVELAWDKQAFAVQKGVVDVSLMRPPVADPEGLRFDLLCREGRVVALPVEHPLAQRDSVMLADLDGEVHVTDDAADAVWVRWWACDPRPSGRPVVYGPSVHTMSELLEVVADGNGISITGEFVPSAHVHPEVVFVQVSDVEPSSLCLCSRSNDSSPMVRAAREVVRAFGGATKDHAWT